MRNLKDRPETAHLDTIPNEHALYETLSEYLAAKRQIEVLETRVKELREPLEAATMAAGGRLEISGRVLNLALSSRESFDLKGARKILAEGVLAPFIKVSEFTRFTVK